MNEVKKHANSWMPATASSRPAEKKAPKKSVNPRNRIRPLNSRHANRRSQAVPSGSRLLRCGNRSAVRSALQPGSSRIGPLMPKSACMRRKQLQRNANGAVKRIMLLYYIILFIFIVVAGIVLSLTVFFNIDAIQVEGNSAIQRKKLLKNLVSVPGITFSVSARGKRPNSWSHHWFMWTRLKLTANSQVRLKLRLPRRSRS